mmetsp:Transcript_104191/g.145150  ORF Transcript_104191/g.145150 Transcript_104191/m.145150 type:complete len:124 (+) Transcript_104191:64-435(+)
MGCAASATTKLTSVMPIDEETVNDDETVNKSQNVVSFQVSDQDEIDFDDSELELCQSFQWPKENRPRGVPLPPGRREHEKHLCRLEKFMRAVRKHQDGFKQYVGRRSSCSSGSSAGSETSCLD